MLKTFLEIEVDKNGKKLLTTKNGRYFDGTVNDKPLKIWTEWSFAFDTKQIANILFESVENNFEYKLDKKNLIQIERLLKNLKNSDNESWIQIHEAILKKQKYSSYTPDDLEKLEQIGKEEYGSFILKFQAYDEQIRKIWKKNENYFDENAYFDLRQKINETIMKWKTSNFEEDKKNFELMKKQFSSLSYYFGSYPVIFITFFTVDPKKGNTMVEIQRSISDAFQKHYTFIEK